MTFEEISEKAFRREELGSCKNLAEKYAYLQLFNLYKDYYNQKIEKNKASMEKAKIQKEFENNSRAIKKYYDTLRHREQIKSKYNNYIIAVEKSKNQDEILYNSLQFIEAIIQDDSFTQRNLDKIDNKDNTDNTDKIFDNKNNL